MKHLLNRKNAALLALLCLFAGYVSAANVSCQTNVFKQKFINISQAHTEEQTPQATVENAKSATNNKTEEKPQIKTDKKTVKQFRFGGMFELLVPARLRKL